MRIENGSVYGPDFRFHETDVEIRDGVFVTDGIGKERIDASGCYVIPGLIDIHFHGCLGADFCDGTPEAVETLARWEALEGITAICPATLTLPVEELISVLKNAASCAARKKVPQLADLAGINMEGPFISQAKKGAQNGDYIIPCDA